MKGKRISNLDKHIEENYEDAEFIELVILRILAQFLFLYLTFQINFATIII